MDLNKAPKQFCENITIGFSKEFFVMAIVSGNTGTAYTLTPQHMKRLVQYATYQLAEFEKENGKVKGDEWVPGVQSPLQIQSLKNQGDQPDNKD